MPDNKVKTEVAVVAKPQGFAKLRDEAGRLNEEVRKGAKDQAEGMKAAGKETEQLGKSIEKAMKALLSGMRARDDLQKMTRQLRDMRREAEQLRGAFTQGLVQGIGFGEFIQRGPGMGRQIAGRAIGGAIRAPFAGAARGQAGAVQALSQIPFGSIAALPLQFAQQAVAFQQQQFRAAPLLGGREAAGAISRIRGQAFGLGEEEIQRRAAVAGEAAGREAADPEVVSRIEENIRKRLTNRRLMELRASGRGRGLPADMVREVSERRAVERAGGTERIAASADYAAREIQRDEAITSEKQRLRAMRGQRQQKAIAAQRRKMMLGLQTAGIKYGAMTAQDSLQFATQVAQAGGGDPRQQDMLRTAIAAQTTFGVGADISGAFLRAGRRGGAIGVQGQGAQGLTDALRAAITLGMEGSEINEFMAQIAGGITNWERTGIPVNTQSVQQIGQVLRGGGFAGGRLQAVAGGVAGGIQRIGREGPESALDMLALTKLGGFQGGGLNDLVSAMARMENLQDVDPAKFAGFIRTLSKVGGGGGAGLLTVRGALSKLGSAINLTETGRLIREVETGAISPERMKETVLSQTKEAGALKAPKNIQDLAQEMIKLTPAVQRQATIQNKQLAAGKQMVTAMQDLEDSAATVNKTVATEIKPIMETLSGAAVRIAEGLALIAEGLHGRGVGALIIEDLINRLGIE